MIVCISGSRSITDYDVVEKAIRASGFRFDLALLGGARGVDSLAKRFCTRNVIQYAVFPPLWQEMGKKAGMVRNFHMIRVADGLIAVWDGESRGTRGTIRAAYQKNRHIVVCDASGEPFYRRSDDGSEETRVVMPGMLE